MPSLRSLPCHQRPATGGAGPTATLPLGGKHDGKLGLLSGRSRQQAATGDRRESLPWHGKHLPYSVLCVSPALTINRHRAQRAGPVTRLGMAHPAPQIAPQWLIDRRRTRRSSSRSGFYVGPRTTCDAAGVLRLMSSRLDPAAVPDRRENDWGPAGGVADGSRSKSQTVLKIRVDEVSVIAGVKADRVVERSVPQ
jgi:hypothetical protein